MSMKAFVANIDRHIYDEGVNWTGPNQEKVAPLQYFAAKAEEAGIAPDDKELAKREEHYLRKFTVPGLYMADRERKIKEYARDTYAVEAVMEHELKCSIKGPDAPTVQKAFTVSTVQAVFPIFYDTVVVAGLLAQPLLDRLVAMTTQVNSGTADHVLLNENTWDRSTGEIGEWTRFPELSISATNAPIKLRKWGGVLKASDEAIRRARLPIFQRGLERIGRQLANDLTDFVLDVILLGDGNAGASPSQATAVSGSPAYSDMIATQLKFPIGYQPTDIVASGTVWNKLLNFPEFKDPLAGFRFQGSGVPPTPLGMNLWRWDSLASSGWATTKILMLESERACVLYQEGGVTSEAERVVNGQWSSVTTSLYAGPAILDTNARVVGTGWS